MSVTNPAPQRVCPHCSTLAATPESHCPWCGRSYRRRILPGVAVLLALAVALTLAGIGAMLVAFGDELDRTLDDSVTTVQRDLDRDIRGIEDRITEELDERLRQVPQVPVP